jgi:RNA polymerase sigma-70 factor (ECF subfamily)
MNRNLSIPNETGLEISDLRMPDQTAISIEELQQLRDAIAQLPYEQREVVILHLQGGKTFRQIAALKDSSIGTIQSRYRYGINKLRQLLNHEVER